MIGTIYDIAKDVVAQRRNDAQSTITAKQLDLMIAEVDRRKRVELENVGRELQQEVGRFKADAAHRGVAKGNTYESLLRNIQLKYERLSDDITKSATFTKHFLELEKQKLGA
jgi:hypothetical protein